MFEDFLKMYIEELVNNSEEYKNIDKETIEDIASDINSNSEIWNIIDMAIYDYLQEYKKEN